MLQSYKERIYDNDVLFMRKKIKRLRINIDPKTLEVKVSVPDHITRQTAISFVKNNYDWIEKNQQKLLLRREKLTNLKNLTSILIFGEEIPLTLMQSSRFSSTFYEDEVVIKVRDFSDEEITRCINLFYKKELALFIEEILPECENLLEEKVSHINYRTMKTRLGTCNPKKRKITLGTRIAQYREECIRMVLIHEIIHFKEFYHNARFKSLMTKYCPNWKALRNEMK